MEQNPDCLLLDGSHHGFVHLVTLHLIFNHRIPLAVCLKADTLTQCVHIVQMRHPFVVNYLQQNHALNLTNLLRLRELSFLCLVKLDGLFLQIVLKLILFHGLLLFVGKSYRLQRNDREKEVVQFL